MAGQTGGARLGSPRAVAVLGGLVLALMAAEPLLAILARQSVNAGNGSVPVWFSAVFAAVGFVVAWRSCVTRSAGLCWPWRAFSRSADASFYVVADYRCGTGGLPFGWVALLAQPGGCW